MRMRVCVRMCVSKCACACECVCVCVRVHVWRGPGFNSQNSQIFHTHQHDISGCAVLDALLWQMLSPPKYICVDGPCCTCRSALRDFGCATRKVLVVSGAHAIVL